METPYGLVIVVDSSAASVVSEEEVEVVVVENALNMVTLLVPCHRSACSRPANCWLEG